MADISRSVLINAPIEKVYAFFCKVKQFPKWYEGLEVINPEPGFPTQVGSTSTFAYKVAGLTMSGNLTIIKEVPLKERHIRLEGMIVGIQEWKFTSLGDATYANFYCDYKISRDLLSHIADKYFIEHLNAKYAEDSLIAMKMQIEAC